MKKYTKVFNEKPNDMDIAREIKLAEIHCKGHYEKHFVDTDNVKYLLDIRIKTKISK